MMHPARVITRGIVGTALVGILIAPGGGKASVAAGRIRSLSAHLAPVHKPRAMSMRRASTSSAEKYTYDFGEVFVVEPSKPHTGLRSTPRTAVGGAKCPPI